MKYKTPRAFEAALKHHIAEKSQETGLDIRRLRQLVAFDRLMARFAVADMRYMIKGGFVLELRLERARTTRDVDLSVYGDAAGLADRIGGVAAIDVEDFFEFSIVPPRKAAKSNISGPGVKYGGLRFRCAASLSGKEFESFGLDVAVADPPTDVCDHVFGIDWLTFAGIEPVRHPVIRRPDHIAQKLHAYTQPRGRQNSRVRDLPDFCLLATSGPLSRRVVRAAVDATFSARATHPQPGLLPPPPEDWSIRYADMARENDLPWSTLDAVYTAARAFIDPVLAEPPDEDVTWDTATWSWR